MSKLTVMTALNLVCGYHKQAPLTLPLNFDINKKSIVALLGTNGRGKSTLLATLLGVRKPLSGQVNCSSSLGFVPQHFSSTFHYSVRDLVLMGRAKQLGFFGKPRRSEIRLAQDNLDLLGIGDLADCIFSHLSGGQKQLVLIARALTTECHILLLDEPTSSLDLHNQKRVLHILNTLAKDRNLTILFSTHDPAQAMSIADKVLLLDQQQYQFGDTNTLLTEANLSQLYRITMKKISCEVGNKTCQSVVPLYFD